MKSVFITFDQAFYERILALLDRQNCRGFSYWQQLPCMDGLGSSSIPARQTGTLSVR